MNHAIYALVVLACAVAFGFVMGWTAARWDFRKPKKKVIRLNG